jgi:hypothetical protein
LRTIHKEHATAYLLERLSGNGVAAGFAKSLVHLQRLRKLIFGLQVAEEEAKYGSVFDGRIGALCEVW